MQINIFTFICLLKELMNQNFYLNFIRKKLELSVLNPVMSLLRNCHFLKNRVHAQLNTLIKVLETGIYVLNLIHQTLNIADGSRIVYKEAFSDTYN